VLAIYLTCVGAGSVTGALCLTLNVGGTQIGDTDGLLFTNTSSDIPFTIAVQHVVTSGQISSGHVLVKPQWLSTSGTITMFNRSAVVRPRLSVANLRQ